MVQAPAILRSDSDFPRRYSYDPVAASLRLQVMVGAASARGQDVPGENAKTRTARRIAAD